MNQNGTEKLSFMKLKKDAKFGEESTCRLNVGIRNLTNFDLSTKVLKIFPLIDSFWAKYILFELKKYRGVIFYETEKEYKIWRGMDLSFQNSHKKFDKFWPEYSKVLQIFTLLGSLWVKYIFLELKKYRGVIFHKTEEGYKVWRGFDLLFQVWHKDLTNFDLSSQKSQNFLL